MIFLDTNLLFWIVHPQGGPDGRALRRLILERISNGDLFAIAEICDYETRRELIRKNAVKQLQRLEEFISLTKYVPINTLVMRDAAQLWAKLRNQGKQTAPNHSIDGDVILAAQANQFSNHVVATKNIKHLSLMCNALDWQQL